MIATQGQGDLDALKAALSAQTTYVAFVGSRKKYASLAEKLAAAGFEQSAIDGVKAPAGLDLGAVTPEEIALVDTGAIGTGSARRDDADRWVM